MRQHRPVVVRLALLVLATLVVPACGGGAGGGAGGSSSGIGSLTLDLRGGASIGVTTFPDDSYGGIGGQIQIAAAGPIRVGVSAAPLAQPLPQAPTTGTELTSIAANITQPGTILISGTVTTDALAGIRIITSTGGDIVVSGTLNAGDPGLGKALDLRLSAPNGTVYITGTINTFNTDGTNDGNVGGALLVDAARIVCSGTINTHGEDRPTTTAGKGGDVTFTIVPAGTDIFVQGGSITTTGGASNGPIGGAGGAISMTAVGEIQVQGSTFTTNGGSVSTTSNYPTGGAAGLVSLEGTGGVTWNGVAAAVGGTCRGLGPALGAGGGKGGDFRINVLNTSGPVRVFGSISLAGGISNAAITDGPLAAFGTAGDAGTLKIGLGGSAAPTSIEMGAGLWTTAGGDSVDTGGAGGAVGITNFSNQTGSLLFNGTLVSSAGTGVRSSMSGGDVQFWLAHGDISVFGSITTTGTNNLGTNPTFPGGRGGDVTCIAGTATAGDSGSVTLGAVLTTTGGDRLGGATANGQSGGAVTLEARNVTGSVTTLASGVITANGGRGSGTGLGGQGGTVRFLTLDERILVFGNVTALGGPAGPAGTGGKGGRFEARSDSDNNDVAGAITIEGPTIDVSGGAGGTGGTAANNGGAASTDASAAIVLASDGNLARAGDNIGDGTIINHGFLYAKGGASTTAVLGGRGGDLMMSGLGEAGPGTAPTFGNVLNSGGAGTPTGPVGSLFSE